MTLASPIRSCLPGRTAVLTSLAVSISMALAGCGGGADEGDVQPPSGHTAGDSADAQKAGPRQRLIWGGCPAPTADVPAGQECALLQVPLDYRNPGGRHIEMAVSRWRSANPARRRGVLLLNPGGPGGSGLDLPALFSQMLPADVLDEYDLIGFDPRFVGHSSPMTCNLSLTQVGALDGVPRFDDAVGIMRGIAGQCADAAGDVLPFATTANVARDMDTLREALGEAKIAYLGYSYGTYLGAVYASLFPQRTGRFVLDSSVSPHAVWREQFRLWGPAGEVRFADLAAFLVANEATYHVGTTPEQVREIFLQTVDRLDQSPVPFFGIQPMNGSMLRAAVFQGLYHDADFPTAARWFSYFAAASSGAAPADPPPSNDEGLLTDLTDAPDPPDDNNSASMQAVVCDDAPWSHSIERYRHELAADSARYPLFASIGSTLSPCAFWPHRPLEPKVDIRSEGPGRLLVVQNLRDPATPVQSGWQMHRALGPRSRMITADQGGHGVYLVTNNACVDAHVSTFLGTGRWPDADLECPASSAPPPPALLKARPGESQAVRELRRRLRRRF